MKNTLITGASSGIGEELAVQYAGPDTRLYLSGRDSTRLQNVAEKCRSKGSMVETKIIDVADRDAMHIWIKTISETSPNGLDIVIANAGISGGFGGRSVEDISGDCKIFDVNLMGVLNTIFPALPAMVRRKSGQIVIMSSLASFVPMPSAPAYSASKVAVRFYGEALTEKLKPHGIKVTVICPGFIKSRMTDANDFPMPFFLQTDKAVARMIRGIEKGKPRVDFPLRLSLLLRLLAILPSAVIRRIFASLPDKKS